MRNSLKQSTAFSIVELLVVVGIIGILVALLFPAIQQVREAARRTACQNHLRQLALAAMSHESSHMYLVGPKFYGLPNDSENRGDVGLFVQLLPFLELSSLSDQFTRDVPMVSLNNRLSIENCPHVLNCPSSSPSILTGLANVFSGPPVPELTSETSDYVGNGGWFHADVIQTNSFPYRGCIAVQVTPNLSPLRLSEIHDGTSNTALLWENSLFGLKRVGWNSLVEVDSNVGGEGAILVDETLILFNGAPTVKNYFYAWCGLQIGVVAAFAQDGQSVGIPFRDSGFHRSINVYNEMGMPFSAHPGGCNFAMVDGSVHFKPDSTDSILVINAAVINDGNSAIFAPE